MWAKIYFTHTPFLFLLACLSREARHRVGIPRVPHQSEARCGIKSARVVGRWMASVSEYEGVAANAEVVFCLAILLFLYQVGSRIFSIPVEESSERSERWKPSGFQSSGVGNRKCVYVRFSRPGHNILEKPFSRGFLLPTLASSPPLLSSESAITHS